VRVDAGNILNRSIPSDLAELDSVCSDAILLLRRCGHETHAFAVTLLLREFVNNAILHGHRSDISKRIGVFVRVGRRWIVVRVTDEGPGFDWRKAKRTVPDADSVRGRGLAIGVAYSEKMSFNRAGNQVTLWIRKAV